ncbi:predicted protein [Nematostella vectensis]|uniref:EGF-like domain-containing protein n=1 Tax=Nematostella vectensis TaxID=45351 RepID=A7SRC9_NEMVE|nr:predicted protein [Nematostella vectensis]|eukprot:XP_001625828.1 predicted protein [Nematostella vectensis]
MRATSPVITYTVLLLFVPSDILQLTSGDDTSHSTFFYPTESHKLYVGGQGILKTVQVTDNFACVFECVRFGETCQTVNYKKKSHGNGLHICELLKGVAQASLNRLVMDLDFDVYTKKNCNHKSCLNGGTCQKTDEDAFRCTCPPEFIGKHCERGE